MALMSDMKNIMMSHLRRFTHLQAVDIEVAVRRIYDWGESEKQVLTELGLSREERGSLFNSLSALLPS